MSLNAVFAAAAAEAQGRLSEIMGQPTTADGNFVGPDGQTYIGVFRAADAFETQAAGMEMQAHGFGDKSLVLLSATRAQFSVAPLGWARRKLTRLYPVPATELTVLSVSTDDPTFYSFALVSRHPATNG